MRRQAVAERPTVAVVGAGVSGLTAAYLLQRAFDVTLYEREPRLGGHAHTHEVATSDDRVLGIDSGFIVHNDRTYPNLLRLFDELEVETQPSSMTMSVQCAGCGLEYAGGDGFWGLFAQARNLANPAFLTMLRAMPRFHRRARALLRSAETSHITLGDFLGASSYPEYFVRHLVVPLISCVWSCPPATALRYPAHYLFRFLEHHGALSIGASPRWRTVVGGSRSYVERIAKRLTTTSVATPVRSVARSGSGVEVRDESGDERSFDRAVIATHADEALGILADPTLAERDLLGAFRYSENETVLHTDGSVLPRSRRARASWNYRLSRCEGGADSVQVNYSANRLQSLDEPVDYVVTLNGADRVEEDAILARMCYTHPIYTPESVEAQSNLARLNDRRVAYAGAYQGWGFHEDGCASGVRAAASLGVEW